MSGPNRQKVQNNRNSNKRCNKTGRNINNKHKGNELKPPITAKTDNQKKMLASLKNNTLTLGIGPAGVGKSFLAASEAGDDYVKGIVDKIIVARPYVTMGKSIGALPGTETEKLYPFLRPILNIIEQRLGKERFQSDFGEGKNIEIQALQSIRGMSFDGNIWLICDEAQNTTEEEVRSIVTRLGEGCKAAFLGDPLQNDLKTECGLTYLERIIDQYDISQADWVKFTEDDCVRSGIVKDFLKAFRKERGGEE